MFSQPSTPSTWLTPSVIARPTPALIAAPPGTPRVQGRATNPQPAAPSRYNAGAHPEPSHTENSVSSRAEIGSAGPKDAAMMTETPNAAGTIHSSGRA
ncbi:MAG: hypothetical protein JJU44_10495 [Planctomycetes bacterium]|nr:hypothetical protein [Planctomycetota bacterium]